MTTRADPRTSGWAERLPQTRAWKGAAGRSRQAIIAEQDRAAGGRERRWVSLGEGRLARASIELKLLPSTRRIRAYLRWSDHGRSPARYVGEVGNPSRAMNLAEAWTLAWDRGLLTAVTVPPGSWASTSAVRAVMRSNKARDTGPELRLRSLLHAAGMRYRVSVRPLPQLRRSADIVFKGPRVAVFVDGCYWHGCSEHYRPATRNSEFWRLKIEGNRRRDAQTDALLTEAGWAVLRIWEHEDLLAAASRVAELVGSRASRPRPDGDIAGAATA